MSCERKIILPPPYDGAIYIIEFIDRIVYHLSGQLISI